MCFFDKVRCEIINYIIQTQPLYSVVKVTNFKINVQNVSPRKRKSCIKSSELNNYKTSTVSNYICMVATNHIEMGFTRKLRPVPGPGIEAEGLVLAENF